MGLKEKISNMALKETKKQMEKQINLLNAINKSNDQIIETMNNMIDDQQHGFKKLEELLQKK